MNDKLFPQIIHALMSDEEKRFYDFIIWQFLIVTFYKTVISWTKKKMIYVELIINVKSKSFIEWTRAPLVV